MDGVNEALKLIAQAQEAMRVYDDENSDKIIVLLQQAIDKLAGASST